MLEVKVICDFVRYCYILTLVLTYFRLMKGRATYFQPEIVASFLHLLVLSYTALFNYIWKSQFVVLHYHAKQVIFIYKAVHLLLCNVINKIFWRITYAVCYQQKNQIFLSKILLSALHSHLIFILYDSLLNELLAFIFIICNFRTWNSVFCLSPAAFI